MFDIFTAWDSLLKSQNKEKLLNVASVLETKTSKDITFSAIDLQGNINKYVLGSIEGNSKFLLGYVNPGFRVCPYHFVILDPNITEEESVKLYESKGHPSNPRFWMDFGIDPFLEGDEEGSPHPSFRDKENRESFSNSQEFIVNNQTYMADPEIQIVYSLSENNVYDWGLLRNTYFSSQMPSEIYSLMEISRLANNIVEKEATPLSQISKSYKVYNWDEDVVPIVKSLSIPGSIYRINQYYGVCSNNAIEIYDEAGISKSIELCGVDCSVIPLNPEEGSGSLVLLEFLDKYLNLDISLLETYVE